MSVKFSAWHFDLLLTACNAQAGGPFTVHCVGGGRGGGWGGGGANAANSTTGCTIGSTFRGAEKPCQRHVTASASFPPPPTCPPTR